MKKTSAFLFTLVWLLASPAFAADSLTVILDSPVNPNHAPIFIAKEMGYFKSRNLEISIVAPEKIQSAVAKNPHEIALISQPQLHMENDKGAGLVRIGTLIEMPLDAVIVLTDGQIGTPTDLKGHKIGHIKEDSASLFLPLILQNHNLVAKDVELIALESDPAGALLSGKVDAIISGWRNMQLSQIALSGRPARSFNFEEEENIPAYDQLVFAVPASGVKNPALPEFIAAIEQATMYLINHPRESWGFFIAGRPQANTEINRLMWRDVPLRFNLATGALDRNRYAYMAAFLKEQRMVKSVPPLKQYAVELPAAKRSTPVAESN